MKRLEFFVNFDTEGLGDKFVLVSTILDVIDDFNRDAIVYFIDDCKLRNFPYIKSEELKWNRYYKGNYSYPSEGIRGVTDFYEVIDFFQFKLPKNKITTIPLKNKTLYNMYQGGGYLLSPWKYTPTMADFQCKNQLLWEEGKYWPINFIPKEKNKNVCYMLYETIQKNYDKNDLRQMFEETSQSAPKVGVDKFGRIFPITGFNPKGITEEQFQTFKTLMDTFPEITFIPLEKKNYARNVEILSKSHFIFASEGMWTHLSRAMNVNSIIHSIKEQYKPIHDQINQQGHYSSYSFDECLNKIKTVCEAI